MLSSCYKPYAVTGLKLIAVSVYWKGRAKWFVLRKVTG